MVANNLANAETTAFKRSRVNFEDLMYLQLKQPGTTNASGRRSPAGIFVGLGTQDQQHAARPRAGSLENTSRPLDVGIQGNGFFKVKILDSLGDGIGYTRNGNFFVNNKGELVLGMGDGYRLIPPITVPTGATDISIGQDGTVRCMQPGSDTKTRRRAVAAHAVRQPAGPASCWAAASTRRPMPPGPPIVSKPGAERRRADPQGFLEASNVDPVKELVTLIKTQRSFELNSQSIQTADQALQTIANLEAVVEYC